LLGLELTPWRAADALPVLKFPIALSRKPEHDPVVLTNGFGKYAIAWI
jgi:hypothetical protein